MANAKPGDAPAKDKAETAKAAIAKSDSAKTEAAKPSGTMAERTAAKIADKALEKKRDADEKKPGKKKSKAAAKWAG